MNTAVVNVSNRMGTSSVYGKYYGDGPFFLSCDSTQRKTENQKELLNDSTTFLDNRK